jgi:hypothetical protein
LSFFPLRIDFTIAYSITKEKIFVYEIFYFKMHASGKSVRSPPSHSPPSPSFITHYQPVSPRCDYEHTQAGKLPHLPRYKFSQTGLKKSPLTRCRADVGVWGDAVQPSNKERRKKNQNDGVQVFSLPPDVARR